MTLTVVPTYFLARTVVSPRAVAVRGRGHRGRAGARVRADDPRGAAQLPVRGARLPGDGDGARPTHGRSGSSLAVVLCLLGGFVRGELGVLPVVLVLAAGLYALSSEAGRRWRSRSSTWDWVGAIVLGAGAMIVFSGLVGKFSQSWAIATGHYRGECSTTGCRRPGR